MIPPPHSAREHLLLEQIDRLRDGMWLVAFVAFVCGVLATLLACAVIAM
jgi:hypothetical protein